MPAISLEQSQSDQPSPSSSSSSPATSPGTCGYTPSSGSYTDFCQSYDDPPVNRSPGQLAVIGFVAGAVVLMGAGAAVWWVVKWRRRRHALSNPSHGSANVVNLRGPMNRAGKKAGKRRKREEAVEMAERRESTAERGEEEGEGELVTVDYTMEGTVEEEGADKEMHENTVEPEGKRMKQSLRTLPTLSYAAPSLPAPALTTQHLGPSPPYTPMADSYP